MRASDLAKFIREREALRVRKESGAPRPWTKDPILHKYRFCNVHRDHDAVTRWLRKNYYPTWVEHEADIWFAAVVARLLNNPEALEAVLPHILPFRPTKFMRVLQERKVKGLKNFNAAYIVSTNGVAMDKIEYIVYRILNILWDDRTKMRPKDGDLLETYHSMLMQFDGLGSFIAAQVIADLKCYAPLENADDWWTFAASGPGSRRGLNRVLGRDPDTPWREMDWRMKLGELAACPAIKAFGLHNQDLQNCLCEFDKYERVRLGEGTPKQIYKERSNG